MAQASRESLNETGIFPTSWVTPDLAKNHEGLENAEPLAVEIAKLMSSATSRSFCLVVATRFGSRSNQTEVENLSDDFNVTLH